MLARKQLEKLQEIIKTTSELHLPFIEKRIAEARDLEIADAARARVIYDGILRLYEKRPWAIAVVNEARQAIERIDSSAIDESSDGDSNVDSNVDENRSN